MSIMKISELIGQELRNTSEGKQVLQLYTKVLNDLDKDINLFFQLEKKFTWGLHFYIIGSINSLLKANVEVYDELFKNDIKKDTLNECANQMKLIGDFVEKLTLSIIKMNVQHISPKGISVTPKLVRYIQDLSVEYQKVDIIQQIMIKANRNFNFINLVNDFNEMRNTVIGTPYTKKDREIIKKLSLTGYDKEEIKLVYVFDNINRIIRQTIYDSFIDKILKISQQEELEEVRQKNVGMLKVVRLKFKPEESIDSYNKWIIKLEQTDGSIIYGQIDKKTMKLEDGLWHTGVDAILYKNM